MTNNNNPDAADEGQPIQSINQPVNTNEYPVDAQSLMPDDEQSLAFLQTRAYQYAQIPDHNEAMNDLQDYIRFKLGDKELYGIAYHYVEQIIPAQRLTPVPCTGKAIAGVINWRGLLLTVIDTGEFFATNNGHHNTDKNSIVVVSDGMITVGMLVDEIDENAQFSPAQLEAPLTTGAVSNIAFVQGIYQGRVTLLNVAAILSDRQIMINKNEQTI